MTTSVLYESLKARPEDKSPVPDLFRAHRYSTIFFQSSVERQELDRPDAISERATNQSSSTRYRNSKQVGPNCQFVGEFLFLWTLGILNGTAISSGRFLVYFCLFTQCFGLIPSSCSFSLQHVFGLNTERIPSSNEHVSCSNQTCIRSILYTFNSKTRPFSFIFCSQRIAFLSSCFVALLFTLLIILFSNFLLLEKSHCALLFIRHNQELYIYYSHTTSLL